MEAQNTTVVSNTSYAKNGTPGYDYPQQPAPTTYYHDNSGQPPYNSGQPPYYQPQQAPAGYYPAQNSAMNSNTVVVTQPTPQYTHVVPVQDNMNLAIFACLCCFWPLGLVAILRANEGRRFDSTSMLSETQEIIPRRWYCPEGYLYLRQEVADPPSKDYFQLIVTSDKTVSFKVWNVTPPFKSTARRAPVAFRSTYEHFSTDLKIRDAIQSRLRGELAFLDNLLEGKFNFLDRLDKQLQLYILSFLDVCSTLRLSATSRHFYQLCEDNSIWKRHFAASCLPYFVTPGLMDIPDQKGWKAFYIIVNRIAQSVDEIGTRFLLQKAPPFRLGHRSSGQAASLSKSPNVQSKTSL